MSEYLFELDEVFLQDHQALLRAMEIATELDIAHVLDFEDNKLVGPVLWVLPKTASRGTIGAVREMLERVAKEHLIGRTQIVRLRSESCEHDTALVLVPGVGAFEIPNDRVFELPPSLEDVRPGTLQVTTVELCTDGYRALPLAFLPAELKPHLG